MAPASSNTSPLLGLPAELLLAIAGYLPNRDLKTLRLTCRAIHGTVALRLHHVFLSAHRRDVDVFRAIADHDTLRRVVTEIIWDDAVLRHEVVEAMAAAERLDAGGGEQASAGWIVRDKYREISAYSDECEDNNIHQATWYEDDDTDADFDVEAAAAATAAGQLPLEESLSYYVELCRAQEETMACGDPARALRYGLERFPALCRVTVTPATHGTTLSYPLYETPTIRALPPGMNYPLPDGWRREDAYGSFGRLPPWVEYDDDDGDGGDGGDGGRRRGPGGLWPGVHTVLDVLASHIRDGKKENNNNGITELVFDAHTLATGINTRLFSSSQERPSSRPTAYENLLTILRQPGFRRLDLALATDLQKSRKEPPLAGDVGTRLQDALAAIGPHLEHLRITTDMLTDPHKCVLIVPAERRLALTAPLLRSVVFPTGHLGDRWPRLRHFALTGFILTRPNLLALLRELPESLQTLELGDLFFLGSGGGGYNRDRMTKGSWRAVLEDMRNTLGWRERTPVQHRPRVRIWLMPERLEDRRPGLAVWVDEASLAAFLYGDGRNPFYAFDGCHPLLDEPDLTLPSVLRDAFVPDFERPIVSAEED